MRLLQRTKCLLFYKEKTNANSFYDGPREGSKKMLSHQ
jgi:hypothetical protein